ncbi:MAG: PHP domain-containing protein [Candidatus Pacebacteria bacterium]|nr:PHP domain-containing protein [Candidatus Paceibacterota bacterium]
MKVRGVSHIHSKYSYDGTLSLSEIKKALVKEGLRFALMTEHTDELTEVEAKKFIRECKELSDKDFIFVSGFEVPYRKAHILMIGVQEFVVSHADDITLPQWKEHAAFSVLAHPHCNQFIVDTVMKVVVDAVEIWNAQYDGKYIPRFKAVKLLNYLQKTRDTKAFCGLDLHRKEHLGGPEIVMEMEQLTTKKILEKIRRGEYTMEKKTMSVSSKGKITNSTSFLAVKSFCAIVFIVFSKWLGKKLHKHGLSVPKELKQKIRSKI